jgi:ABC-type polysaccharide/polyol phosphate export permease
MLQKNHHDVDVKMVAPSTLPTSSVAEGARAGVGAGSVLGIVVGITLWAQMPDIIQLPGVLLILFCCVGAGALIGMLVSGVDGTRKL